MSLNLRCLAIGFLIAAIMLLTGCTPWWKDPLPIHHDPGQWQYVSTGVTNDTATLSDQVAKSKTETEAAIISTKATSTGVDVMLDKTKIELAKGSTPAVVAATLNDTAKPVRTSVSATLDHLIKSLSELTAAQSIALQLSSKVTELTTQTDKLDKDLATALTAMATKDAEHVKALKAQQAASEALLAEKEKAWVKANAALNEKWQADYDKLKKDTDKEIAALREENKQEKSFWGRLLSGFIYLGSFGLGVGGLFILIFLKDVKLAVQTWAFSMGVPIVLFVMNGIYKSERVIGWTACILVCLVGVRVGFAFWRKSKGVKELVESMEIIKVTPAITDENSEDPTVLKAKKDILKIQSDDTIADVDLFRDQLKAKAAQAATDIAAKAQATAKQAKSWWQKLMFWKKG